MNRSMLKLLVVFVLLPVLGFGCWLQHGAWMMHFSPSYKEKNLLGLTVAQVEQKLGAPDYDPRKPWPYKRNPPKGSTTTQPDWRDERDGRLALAYYQNWATTTIWFENGRVVEVKHFWK
jgi:hypothetical protein